MSSQNTSNQDIENLATDNDNTETIEQIPLIVEDDHISESKEEDHISESKEEEKQERPLYDCAVCYTSLNVENIVNTTCNHKYCKKCFFRWMKTSPSCPLCRKNLVSRSQWYENCNLHAELTEIQALNEEENTKLIHIKQQLFRKTIQNENLINTNTQLKKWNLVEMRRKISLREDIDYSRGYLKALNEDVSGEIMKNGSKNDRYCTYMGGYFAGYYNRKEITGDVEKNEFKNSSNGNEERSGSDESDVDMNCAESDTMK